MPAESKQQNIRSFASFSSRLADQRGFALILAVVMLAILSILGAFALTSSTTEIGISGNYRTAQQAFFAAERAIEYSLGNTDILSSTTDVDLNAGLHPARLAVAGSGRIDPTATNVVQNLVANELPDSLAEIYSREKFGGNYYVISVTGEAPGGRSKVRVETQQVRIFQKDDEGQLITTSGG